MNTKKVFEILFLALPFLAGACATTSGRPVVCNTPPVVGKRVVVVSNSYELAPLLTVVEPHLRALGAIPIAFPPQRHYGQILPQHDLVLEASVRDEGSIVTVYFRLVASAGGEVLANGAGSAYHNRGHGWYYINGRSYYGFPSREEAVRYASRMAASAFLCRTVAETEAPSVTATGVSSSTGGGLAPVFDVRIEGGVTYQPAPTYRQEWFVPDIQYREWGRGGVFSSGPTGTISGWERGRDGKLRRVWQPIGPRR